jgi:hypothetical protein
VLDALEAGGIPWPGPLTVDDRHAFERLLDGVSEDGRTPLLSAVMDPDRNAWARAAFHTLHFLTARGARFVGFASDDALEFEDQRGERFGAIPLAFTLPPHPGGEEGDVTRMLGALDAAFAHRRYALWLRRPLPDRVDVDPVRRAVHLWLTALERGDRTETHAVYEDDDIALDLTIIPPAQRGGPTGRLVTVMPLPSLDRLAVTDGRIVEAAAKAEESAGDLPLVCLAVADRPWKVSRGYMQQLLYGTPDRVETTLTGGSSPGAGSAGTYEAEFTATGRSMFSDPACKRVAEAVWLEPGAQTGALSYRALSLQNPWAAATPAIRSVGRTFTSRSERGARKVVLRWEPGA